MIDIYVNIVFIKSFFLVILLVWRGFIISGLLGILIFFLIFKWYFFFELRIVIWRIGVDCWCDVIIICECDVEIIKFMLFLW